MERTEAGDGGRRMKRITMTERKPPPMSCTSWIDQQIMEAEKRGAFDNLPGTGKPLPDRGDADYRQAWLRDYLRREGVATEELLPTPLRLRKEAERLAAGVQNLRSEQDVREAVQDLNRRITNWRQAPLGPPIFVPLVSAEQMAATWRAAHYRKPSAPAPADRAPERGDLAPPRRGWWRRVFDRRR